MIAKSRGCRDSIRAAAWLGPSAWKTPQCGVFSEAGRSPGEVGSEAPLGPYSLPHPFESLPNKQRKSHHEGGLFFGGDVGTRNRACGLGRGSALRLHWSLIHHRARSSPFQCTNKRTTHPGGSFIGGDVGTRTLDLCDVNTAL